MAFQRERRIHGRLAMIRFHGSNLVRLKLCGSLEWANRPAVRLRPISPPETLTEEH